MKPQRVMLVGAVGAGKSTLIKALTGTQGPVTKTQSLEYLPYTIDTPGEFLENPLFYRALFATALEADRILFLQDATRSHSVFPPGFAGGFAKPSLGVVTKIDAPGAQVQRAREILQGLGLSGPILAVSAWTGEGLEELRKILGWDNFREEVKK